MPNPVTSSPPVCNDQSCLRKPQTETEVLKYVLLSAPLDSLKDLSKDVNADMLTTANLVNKGGFAIIYKVPLSIMGTVIDVAIKRLNLKGKVVKNFARELRVASRLDHKNTLQALGYVYREDTHTYYIVSRWMERGSLRDCMKDLSPTALFDMAVGIAEGLSYLHALAIVHADVKTDNVLVSSEGRPMLADFGLSRLICSAFSKGYYSTETVRSSIRWRAFEYYDHDEGETFLPNQETDVWAFGMTLLELITLDVPYAHILCDNMVVRELVRKNLPPKPIIIDSELNAVTKHHLLSTCSVCWTEHPGSRPSMRRVCDGLSSLLATTHTVSIDRTIPGQVESPIVKV